MTLTPEDLLSELTAVETRIAEARGEMQEGHMPDLRGLDVRVGVIYKALMGVASAGRASFVPRLQSVIETLNACEAEMQALHAQKTKAAR